MSSLVVAVGVLFALFLRRRIVQKIHFAKKYRFPNVVPGWPIIGNFLDVPYPAGMWGVEMAKKYGEMYDYYFNLKA